MVQPLALQDNLGKTSAVEKITQIEKAQPELAQRDNAVESQRKITEQQNKPQATVKTDEVIIHRQKDQKQNKDEKKKSDASESDSDNEPARDENETPEQNDADEQKDKPRKHLDIQA